MYHYSSTTGEKRIFTRETGRISSFTFHPAIPEKLYFVNANDNKIYRTHYMNNRWYPEEVVYEHTTYIDEIAFAFENPNDPSTLRLFFSEAHGAGGGKIYKIVSNKAKLYYTVSFWWAGTFAFDENGVLYLSSGNRVPASIYKVSNLNKPPVKIFTFNEPIMGFVVKDNTIYFANHGDKIYKLDLNTKSVTVVYSNASHKHISDVGFRPGPTPVTIAMPDLTIQDITAVKKGDYYYIEYLIKNSGNANAGQSETYLYIDGKYVASDTVSSLSGKQSTWQSFNYKIKGDGKAHVIKVCADATRKVTESNEDNNCREKSITFPGTAVIIYLHNRKQGRG